MVDFDNLLKERNSKQRNKMTEQTNGKRYPHYTGKIQLKDEANTPAGKISLWDNLEPTKENSPLMTGEVTVGDRIYRVSLWKFTPKQQ